MRNQSRNGVTALEVFVVIVASVILMGLLIPWLERDHRGPYRRNECYAKLKSLSFAAILYEDSKGRLPGWAMDFGTYGWDAERSTSVNTLTDPSIKEVTSSNLEPHRKIGTWAVAILPWLDAQPTYEHWTDDRYPAVLVNTTKHGVSSGRSGEGYHPSAAPNPAFMQCPSDGVSVDDHGNNSYVINAGIAFPLSSYGKSLSLHLPSGQATEIDWERSMTAEFGVSGNQLAARDPASDEMVRKGTTFRLSDFRDGTGTTVLFSESLHVLPWHRSGFTDAKDLTFAETPDEVFFPRHSRFTNAMVWHSVDWENGGKPAAIHRINGLANTPQDFLITPETASDLARPSSAHHDGVNVSMADGGTRFITNTIDYRVWQAMMTPAGHDHVPQEN